MPNNRSSDNVLTAGEEEMTLGGRLYASRQNVGMSLNLTSRLLGVKASTLKSWESDRSEPRVNKLVALAGLLGVSPTHFLAEEGNDGVDVSAIKGPRGKLAKVLENNQRCARRFMASLDRIDLVPPDPRTLLNLNRPEHLVELQHLHEHGAIEKEVKVEFFAKLSQEAGMESDVLHTSVATIAGLWEELRLKHHFSLDLPHVKPAIDNEFAEWTDLLSSVQTISFMPPFAGG